MFCFDDFSNKVAVISLHVDFFIHILSYMGKVSKGKHLIDPNYLQDMLFLWKPLKYFFLFPFLGENLRMPHILEKGQCMWACGTSTKVLNQDWYWISLWCTWMQMGFVFINTVNPCFSRGTSVSPYFEKFLPKSPVYTYMYKISYWKQENNTMKVARSSRGWCKICIQ